MAGNRPGNRVRYALEGAAAYVAFALLAMLPLGLASALGAALLGAVGPRLRAHTRAKQNMARALPALSPAEGEANVRAMWRNLGRVAAEYPHIPKLRGRRLARHVEVVGKEHIEAARNTPEGGLIFTGHIGNWEVNANVLIEAGLKFAAVYRAPNNPVVDKLIRNLRGTATETLLPKGAAGARGLIKVLKSGGTLAMLVDQKMNDGIAVPFFGRDAMTAPALAELALKYERPVWPVRCERLSGTRFRVTVYPQMELPNTGDHAADVHETMRRINELLEGWIRERPAQWLWPHRRWPD